MSAAASVAGTGDLSQSWGGTAERATLRIVVETAGSAAGVSGGFCRVTGDRDRDAFDSVADRRCVTSGTAGGGLVAAGAGRPDAELSFEQTLEFVETILVYRCP